MPVGAVIGSAVVGAGSTAYASSKASKAAKKASDAQTEYNMRALEQQQQQYEQNRADLAPWREAGAAALAQLAQVHGITIPGVDAGGNQWSSYLTANPDVMAAYRANEATYRAQGETPEQFAARHYQEHGQQEGRSFGTPAGTDSRYAGFYASPDYQFRFDEGMRAITGNRAARGLLNSGALGQGLINYGQQAASQEFGNWYNRLSGLAGVGQSAVNSGINAGQANSNAQTDILTGQGQQLASSYQTQGGIQAGLISGLGGTAAGLIPNLSDTMNRIQTRPTPPVVLSTVSGGPQTLPALSNTTVPNFNLWGASI